MLITDKAKHAYDYFKKFTPQHLDSADLMHADALIDYISELEYQLSNYE